MADGLMLRAEKQTPAKKRARKRAPQKRDVHIDAIGHKATTHAGIMRAAVDLFFQQGFMATTTRQIAAALSLTPGALYNHFVSKEQLLYEIIRLCDEEAERALSEAITRASDSPEDQLAKLVQAFVKYTCKYRRESLVATQNYQFLPEPLNSEIRQRRLKTRSFFEEVLNRGQRKGVFKLPLIKGKPSARIAAIALGDMSIRVAEWFVPNGALTDEEVGDLYAKLALNMVRA